MLTEKAGISACPALVLKEGKPYLGCDNVGSSFDVVAQQGMINMIGYGMSPAEVKKQPLFFKNWPPGQPVRLMTDKPGLFSSALLSEVNARGIDIESTDAPNRVTAGGIWVVGSHDPETGVMSGGVTSGTHSRVSASDAGLVEAY